MVALQRASQGLRSIALLPGVLLFVGGGWLIARGLAPAGWRLWVAWGVVGLLVLIVVNTVRRFSTNHLVVAKPSPETASRKPSGWAGGIFWAISLSLVALVGFGISKLFTLEQVGGTERSSALQYDFPICSGDEGSTLFPGKQEFVLATSCSTGWVDVTNVSKYDYKVKLASGLELWTTSGQHFVLQPGQALPTRLSGNFRARSLRRNDTLVVTAR